MSHATPTLDPSQIELRKGTWWTKLPVIGIVVGIGGLGTAAALAGDHQQQFWFSYLTALMYWLAIGLGGLFFVLVQHATRAGWSIGLRRVAENVMITLPVLALLALPIILGLGHSTHELFHWTHTEVVESDPMLSWKRPYLNEQRFSIFGVFYVVAWSALAIAFYSWSTKQDETTDVGPLSHKMRGWAPLGLVLFALTLTFAALDWIMSLDPHWFSTIFGVYYFAGVVVSIHAFLAIVVVALQRSGYMRGVATREHYHDLGKMMFAFSVFWAYIAFSQYFLIWYASIPEETFWFSYRGKGEWLNLSLVLVFGRFVVPFVLFMSRYWKRNAGSLVFWAVWMLTIEYVDLYWLIQPVLAHEHGSHEIHFGLLDVATFLGIGGLFLATFGWALSRRKLVPIHDPRLPESLRFENF